MIDFKKYAEEFRRRDEPLKFGTPVSDMEIRIVEKSLNVIIHGQYNFFLKNIGGIAIFNSWINGIPRDEPLAQSAANVNGDTLRMREKGLPDRYIVIETSDEEFAICLDSLLEESPVYGIDIPFKGKITEMAPNFNNYIQETLDECIKVIDGDSM